MRHSFAISRFSLSVTLLDSVRFGSVHDEAEPEPDPSGSHLASWFGLLTWPNWRILSTPALSQRELRLLIHVNLFGSTPERDIAALAVHGKAAEGGFREPEKGGMQCFASHFRVCNCTAACHALTREREKSHSTPTKDAGSGVARDPRGPSSVPRPSVESANRRSVPRRGSRSAIMLHYLKFYLSIVRGDRRAGLTIIIIDGVLVIVCGIIARLPIY